MAQDSCLPIDSILLSVSDIGASQHFFVDLLGLDVIGETDGCARLDTPGVGITLVDRELICVGCNVDLGRVEGGIRHNMIACHVAERSDVDRICDDLRNRGVSFAAQPKRYDWNAYAAYFTDPDGYVLEIFCWDEGGPLDRINHAERPKYADADASGPLTVTSLCLFVEDVRQCLDFYENAMGMKATRLNLEEGFANFSGAGSDFSMWRREWVVSSVGLATATPLSPYHGQMLNCRLPDRAAVDRQYRRMLGKGLGFLAGPSETAWGRYCAIFADPDGNLWSLGTPSGESVQ